jgi:hypothetical protein
VMFFSDLSGVVIINIVPEIRGYGSVVTVSISSGIGQKPTRRNLSCHCGTSSEVEAIQVLVKNNTVSNFMQIESKTISLKSSHY